MNRTLVVFACLMLAAVVRGAEPVAETIYSGGEILTMDSAASVAEAVAVGNGRILAVGTEKEVARHGGPATRRVDLAGATMLPGFYAAHDHMPQAGIAALYQVDLNSPPVGPVESIDHIVAALASRARQTPKGGWIVGRGYDDTLIAEGRHPTRDDLDRASREHPIWIIHTSGHLGVANSRALEIARVTRDSPKPRGGVIRRDDHGEPNGVFEECGSIVSRHIPGFDSQQRLAAIAWCNQHYLSKGVTTSVVCGGGRQSIADLEAAIDKDLLHLRVVAMLSAGSGVPATPAEAARLSRDADRIHVGAVKIWHDGSIQGFTGYLSQPYHTQRTGQHDDRGYPMRSRDALVEMVAKYHAAGYQLAIHGNGDAAIDDILHAYQVAQQARPRRDARHRIEHCQTPRSDQLDAMERLGITPSFFVGHVYYWGDRHRDIFLGPDRAARISPLASALNRSLRFTIHNDTPVTPVDPLLLVWAAVNRLTRQGQVLGAAERIGCLAALRAVTSDAAWQNFEETRNGSIEPGKLADFVVLAENPLKVPPSRIKDIAIRQTIVGGKTAWSATP